LQSSVGNQAGGATANNHLLNTFLMKGCSLTFGNSELSLPLLVFLRNEVPLFALFLLMLTSAAALPILEHRLFYTLFPIARAALYYVSLYVVVLLSGFYVLTRLSSTRWNKMMALMAPATIAMALGWHFYRSFNTHFVYAWPYDAHNDEILQIIDRDREHNFGSRTVNLGNSWNMEPSLNFYRVTHNYTWLAPVTQKPISNRYNDYIYAFLSEIEELSRDDRTRLASYADTQTVLLRVNHAHKSWPLSSTLASESEKS
jgi:hypothetical protein